MTTREIIENHVIATGPVSPQSIMHYLEAQDPAYAVNTMQYELQVASAITEALKADIIEMAIDLAGNVTYECGSNYAASTLHK